MPKTLIGSRRSALEIIMEILAVCGNGGAGKTAVMYRSNLSYTQLVRYLAFLCEERLLAENGLGRFQITDKGRKTLDQMSGVVGILQDLREREGGEGEAV